MYQVFIMCNCFIFPPGTISYSSGQLIIFVLIHSYTTKCIIYYLHGIQYISSYRICTFLCSNVCSQRTLEVTTSMHYSACHHPIVYFELLFIAVGYYTAHRRGP